MVITEGAAATISAGIDGGQPWRHSFGGNITYTDRRRDNFYRAVRRPTPGVKRLGIEFDHVHLDHRKALEAALPGVAFVDIAQPSMWMRSIKSAEEHALIRTGARICDRGGWAVAGAVKAGVPEDEVAIAGTNAMIREIANSFPFVELTDTWTWFQPGITTDVAVHRRGLEVIRPGAKCNEIALEPNDMYRQWDLLKYRSFGYGHSFGVLSHYHGREAGVELREHIETGLRPGMVVSMEPMVMLPEGMPGAGGRREHDILIVTETGAENITGFPFGPEHNIIRN
jgi:creatinase